MFSDLTKFIIKEAILTLTIIIVGFLLFSTVLKSYYLPVYFIILALVSVLSLVFYQRLHRIENAKSSTFISGFMLISGIKIMIYLIFIVTYVFLYKENAVKFLIVFFILYIIYTFFDIYILLKKMKSKK